MSKLMGKQTGDHLIPVHPSANFRHGRMAGIDPDGGVICTSSIAVFRCPIDVHMDSAVIPIPFCLCRSHILEMTR